jgi:hypothetical protein
MNVRSGQVIDAAMRVHSKLHEAQLLSYLKLSDHRVYRGLCGEMPGPFRA